MVDQPMHIVESRVDISQDKYNRNIQLSCGCELSITKHSTGDTKQRFGCIACSCGYNGNLICVGGMGNAIGKRVHTLHQGQTAH